jgi:hypothetical protein
MNSTTLFNSIVSVLGKSDVEANETLNPLGVCTWLTDETPVKRVQLSELGIRLFYSTIHQKFFLLQLKIKELKDDEPQHFKAFPGALLNGIANGDRPADVKQKLGTAPSYVGIRKVKGLEFQDEIYDLTIDGRAMRFQVSFELPSIDLAWVSACG